MMFMIFLGLTLLTFKKKIAGIQLITGGIALLSLAGFSPAGLLLLSTLENRFDQPDPNLIDPTPAGIILLGGAIDSDLSLKRNTIAINDHAERLIEGLLLLRKFPMASAIVHDPAARNFLIKMDVSPKRIILEEDSRNTYENAKYIKRLVEPKDGQTWLLVTSAYHMPRAVGSFRKAEFPILPWPVDYRATRSVSLTNFFRKPSEGLNLVDLAAKEWVGMLGYFITGRSSELFPSPH